MNIYRLQSVEELELLQSRIKAKAKSTKVHINELRTNTGTDLNAAPQPNVKLPSANTASQSAGAAQEWQVNLDELLPPKAAKKASRTHQERATASKKLKVASDKDYWAKTLQKQCEDSHIPYPVLELMFHPERKWRFDCAWTYLKMAVEIEGAIWTQGRHTRGKGFLQDMEKYNEATRLGWRVFRFTPNQVKMRAAVEYLKLVLA